MAARESKPLLYVGLHGTDDPTLASFPFVLAAGAASAELDASIALLGEAAMLAHPGLIGAVHGVGFPPLAEVWEKVRDHEVPVYV